VSDFAGAMRSAFGPERLRSRAPLAPLTTFRVGGPADWLIETRNSDEIERALSIARAASVRVTILGGGSNVLVADSGVRGLVIRPRGGEVRAIDDCRIRADAAVTINGLVRWTINHGRAGLEAWAGTPGTVGGAIFGNAHFAGRPIADVVTGVTLVSPEGAQSEVPASAMAFGYDRSRLQQSGEVLLSADFRVSAGDPAALRAIARQSLAFRKRTLFKMDFAEAVYISELRSGAAGHFSYRNVAYAMYEEVARKHPALAKYFRVTDVREPIDLLKR